METSWLVPPACIGMNRVTVLPYGGVHPRIHGTVFLADGCVVIGDVEIGEESSVWFNVVVRGDVHWIRIGRRTNIQDLSVLHVSSGVAPLSIGSGVTVGHRAVLHGCTVEDTCLIGMGAVVLDRARIGTRSLVAAGAVVPEGFDVPEGSLVAGVPAAIKRNLRKEEIEALQRSADNYVNYAQTYRQSKQER